MATGPSPSAQLAQLNSQLSALRAPSASAIANLSSQIDALNTKIAALDPTNLSLHASLLEQLFVLQQQLKKATDTAPVVNTLLQQKIDILKTLVSTPSS